MNYLLDTNVFWELIRAWNSNETLAIIPDLEQDGKFSFSITAITAMEIYSVLGKTLRTTQSQDTFICNRKVRESIDNYSVCGKEWMKEIPLSSKLLSRRMAIDLKGLIRDILTQRHDKFEIQIIPINDAIIQSAGHLLSLYADKYDFHSLDSIIASSATLYSLQVITFDKPLKNVMRLHGIPYYIS